MTGGDTETGNCWTGSVKRENVICGVAVGCVLCVCACVAVVNKIRLKVTDGLRAAEGLRPSHAARLHEASPGYYRGRFGSLVRFN